MSKTQFLLGLFSFMSLFSDIKLLHSCSNLMARRKFCLEASYQRIKLDTLYKALTIKGFSYQKSILIFETSFAGQIYRLHMCAKFVQQSLCYASNELRITTKCAKDNRLTVRANVVQIRTRVCSCVHMRAYWHANFTRLKPCFNVHALFFLNFYGICEKHRDKKVS